MIRMNRTGAIAVAAAVALSWPLPARAGDLPESAFIDIEQRFEYREPSLIVYHEMEGFELPVLDYVEDMLFAAGIEPLPPGDGEAPATIRIALNGRAAGGMYLEPDKAYLYAGANLFGEIEVDGPDGARAAGEFSATVQRPFRITLNLGYEDPRNAPFMEALEQPGGFIEELCHALAGAWGVESILPSLREDNPAIRSATATALGHIGDRVAVPGLVEALHDRHERVRWEAAWSLGRIGDARAVPDLIDALDDDSHDVRWFSSWSLRAITGEDFGPDRDRWIGWWEDREPEAQG